jgi:hypothetical protein
LPCSEDWGRRPKFLRRIKIGIGRGCLLPIILFRLSEIIFGGIDASFPLRERTQVHICHLKEEFIRNEEGQRVNENTFFQQWASAVLRLLNRGEAWRKFTELSISEPFDYEKLRDEIGFTFVLVIGTLNWGCFEGVQKSCFGCSCRPAI